MMAFRSKKTVTQLARVFHISEIIKGKRFGEDLKTDLPVINMAGLEIQKDKCDQQVLTNNQPLDNNTMLNISDSIAISKRFGVVEPGKGVRQRAEDRICRMGKDLGFGSFTWYEVPNLLNDGRNRFISVIWKRGREITVAFQVRRKRQGIDIVTSLKDRRKLDRLQANEKYIVNVSEKTGKAYFHRVTDWDNKNLWITKSTENVVGQKSSSDHEDSKAYSLDEIRLKHARAYESWTEAEDKELISEYHNNLTVSEIAKRHQRQRSAIRSRLRKFGKLGLI
jgi:DNA-directed RNA polymerase specialized sigma24 family protein